jgi:ABC-type multidrug transport system fused ATPase/permease subunit
LPLGLDTILGERGVQLSGGQLQRIGIARAIYRESSVLILDEMTSSLDSVTEKEILASILDLQLKNNLTIIMVTHKVENLKGFDFVFEIKNKSIKRVN